jgi:Na+/melibiose symporter-like transporter
LIFIFFKPENVGLMFGSQILHGFFYGITIPILWAMIPMWPTIRNGKPIAGYSLIFSAMMVGLKAGLSIGSALVAWILGLYGYIEKESAIAGQAIVQPETVAQGAKMLVSVFLQSLS